MEWLNCRFPTADWKSEKHVPVIEFVNPPVMGEPVKVTVTVGKEIPHPNKTEHHIEWVHLYFLPDEEKFPYVIAKFDFVAHGASTAGPDTSTVYTIPEGTCSFDTEKNGTLIAISSCNIHGLWKNSEYVELQQQ